MLLRIRPGLELVWRDPTTLQVGAPDPLVVVDDVSDGLDWVLARLRSGTTERGAFATGRRYGVESAEVRRLLDSLRPALSRVDHDGRRAPIAAAALLMRPSGAGCAAHADLATHVLRECDVRVRQAGPDEFEPAGDDADTGTRTDTGTETAGAASGPTRHDEVVITIAPFAAALGDLQSLMATDTPHVVVLVGDHAVEVTPVIEPGVTACARCDSMHRIDLDRAWLSVTAQLRHRTPRFTPLAPLAQAFAIAGRSIAARASAAEAADEPPVLHRIDFTSGRMTTAPWRFHPECGCRAVPETSTPRVLRVGRRRPSSSIAAGAARA